jgi:hypothetical protein
MHTALAFASWAKFMIPYFCSKGNTLLVPAVKARLNIQSANSSIEPNTGMILFETLSIECSIELFSF